MTHIFYGIPRCYRGYIDMPVIVNGQTYYRTAEVCRMVGISRNTLFRWLKGRVLTETEHRDRRGWRLFTDREVIRLRAEANRLVKVTW
jgi:transposase-like protein